MDQLKVLVVGNGGREHAIVLALSGSQNVSALHCAPGNAGTKDLAMNHNVSASDIEGIVSLSKELDVRYITQGTLWKMGEIFQLSIELYDTKENKVTWSDRWQENWKNLSKIKENLSDGLLKALSTTQKRRNRSNNGNTEAYEYYL